MPIAGLILAFVMTLELIQIITDKNNFHDIETAAFFRWIFKTACAILIVTNTWNIVMGVFDVAQSVVNNAAGLIVSDTSIDISAITTNLEARLMEMDIGPLFALGFQGFLIIVCVAIYAVLVRGIAVDADVSKAIWTCMGYTVLLCFTLFKTGSLAKSIFNAH